MGKKSVSAKQKKKMYNREFGIAMKEKSNKTDKKRTRTKEHELFSMIDSGYQNH